MGYYHTGHSKSVSNLCKIILPWRKYLYKHLPMGVTKSPDIYQQKMNELFHGFESICAYIDYMLILTKGDRTYRVQNS